MKHVCAEGCLRQTMLALRNHLFSCLFIYTFEMKCLRPRQFVISWLAVKLLFLWTSPLWHQCRSSASPCWQDTFGQRSTLSTQPGGDEAPVQQYRLQLCHSWEGPYVSSLWSLSLPRTAKPLGLSHICVLILLSTRCSGGLRHYFNSVCELLSVRWLPKRTIEKWTQGSTQDGGIHQWLTPSLDR